MAAAGFALHFDAACLACRAPGTSCQPAEPCGRRDVLSYLALGASFASALGVLFMSSMPSSRNEPARRNLSERSGLRWLVALAGGVLVAFFLVAAMLADSTCTYCVARPATCPTEGACIHRHVWQYAAWLTLLTSVGFLLLPTARRLQAWRVRSRKGV